MTRFSQIKNKLKTCLVRIKFQIIGALEAVCGWVELQGSGKGQRRPPSVISSHQSSVPKNVQNMSLREALGWADIRLLSFQGWLQQKVNFFTVIVHLCTT